MKMYFKYCFYLGLGFLCNSVNSFYVKSNTLWSNTRKNYAVKHKIDVPLKTNSYPIYIGKQLHVENRNLFRDHIQSNKVLIITNDVVAPLHLQPLQESLSHDYTVYTIVLPDGEEEKQMTHIMNIIKKALHNGLDRNSVFIGLGGGVIGDMTGFAASIYMRGISYIQIPTTLMSMIDSSIGGKTGINHELGKNLMGTFHQPCCVMIDIDYLHSLPYREYVSGFSEMVKYGLIQNRSYLTWLENNVMSLKSHNECVLYEAIYVSCLIKSNIIAEDEYENGNRVFLNLGHTFGHALETCLGYGTLLHGEAISIGIMMSMDLSLQMNYIDKSDVNRIRSLFRKLGLPVSLHTKPNFNIYHMMQTMMLDKKNKDNILYFILLTNSDENIIHTCHYDKVSLHYVIQKYIS